MDKTEQLDGQKSKEEKPRWLTPIFRSI